MIEMCRMCHGSGRIGMSWDSRVCDECDGAGVVEYFE